MIPYISSLAVKNSCTLNCTNSLAQMLEGYSFQSPNRQLQHFFLLVLMFFFALHPKYLLIIILQSHNHVPGSSSAVSPQHREVTVRRTEAPTQRGTQLLYQSHTGYCAFCTKEGAGGGIKGQCHLYTESWSRAQDEEPKVLPQSQRLVMSPALQTPSKISSYEYYTE